MIIWLEYLKDNLFFSIIDRYKSVKTDYISYDEWKKKYVDKVGK